MKLTNRWFGWLVMLILLCLLGLCMTTLVLAQTNDPGTNAPPSNGVLPIFQQLKPIEFLLIPAVTILIQALRKFIPAIPDKIWPWVAPLIGAILDFVASKAGWWTGNVAVGAMLGGLGTWFHQLDKNSVNLLEKIMPPAPKPLPTDVPS